MNHPERIVRTLDCHLSSPTRLILYGRAALALGFPDTKPEFHATLDVDAILPQVVMDQIDADEQFWSAVERTNEQLRASGLYLTHLFLDSQVILRPEWLDQVVPVHLGGLRHLTLFRPATTDLILTKMMRIDPQDREDIRFLLGQGDCNPVTLTAALSEARIPPVPEIADAFTQNRLWLEPILAAKVGRSR